MIPLKFFLISNGLNIVLDPIFIFTLGWGITLARLQLLSLEGLQV